MFLAELCRFAFNALLFISLRKTFRVVSLMVADRPGLTWRDWALEGADAGRLLGAHGRERLSTAFKHDVLPATSLTHQARHSQTEMLPHSMPHVTSHASQRKSQDGRDGKIWRELVAISPSNETKRSTAASSGPQSPRYEGEPNHDGIAVWRETQSLGETLGTEPGPWRPSLKGRSPVSSPVRHRPTSASLFSERPGLERIEGPQNFHRNDYEMNQTNQT